MKFTDGFWHPRPGVTPLFAREVRELEAGDGTLTVLATTAVIRDRGDTLNSATLTVTLSSPADGVIRARIEHHRGGRENLHFPLPGGAAPGTSVGTASVDGDVGVLRSGSLTATVTRGPGWSLSFDSDEFADTAEASADAITGGGTGAGTGQISARRRHLTGSGARSVGHMTFADGTHHVHEQLELGVGELVYGLGERFGPVVKNGQSVEIWNADGGTSSEQSYKNVPFSLSNRGYGVLVDDPGAVSYEVGSEAVERLQFSVPGERLDYLVIDGPTPKDVLRRYTALTGRPARVPAWSYGVWLSTSFTTDYDEATVMSFIDGMAERGLPLSVFHFDCFWMREFAWCDFVWDPATFPDPEGLLRRLHERGLRVCVWINPYIGQRSALFAEGKENGYLLTRPDGDVWQWDQWQAGMALVDFTNPDAVAWYQGKLRRLLEMGVDAFKTDFGERVPTDAVYADGSDPQRMHNWYTQLYNRAVFDLLEQECGTGEAVLFARSATVGGQQLPVHWGGDSTSTHVSMAETLRGGLSLAASGFGFWSHDIGGFEGTPDPGVYKRWTAFGLLSSHSRFHGSTSYRVPWAFDDEAVEVTRRFSRLKMRLMPYLYAAGLEASATGVPVLRPMVLEFPGDPAVGHLETQYLLGPDLLVAPVFTADGTVEFYLPAGTWTNHLTGETVAGPTWRRETHGFLSLPLWIRDGAVLALSAREDGPEFDLAGLTLLVHPTAGVDPAPRTLTVTDPAGATATFRVERSAGRVVATCTAGDVDFALAVPGGEPVASSSGRAEVDATG